MAKWRRGSNAVHPMTRTHVALNLMHPNADGTPSLQGFCRARPVANTPQLAVEILQESKVVNVPRSREFIDETLRLWATANIRSEMDEELAPYPPAAYDEHADCVVCTHGGFCRDAAKELAHDIACILKMTGELPEAFAQAQQNVAAWMTANHITGGDSSQLCDRYMDSRKAAA